MRKTVLSISLLLSIATPVSAQVLSFIPANDFKSFVNGVVPAPHRGKFAAYYKDFEAKVAKKSTGEQQTLRYTQYKTALDSLQEEHRGWADKINLFLSDISYLDTAFDKERADVRQYLYWYGAYEGFQVSMHIKAPTQPIESKKFLDNVRIQLSKAGNKVGGWFKTLKTKLT